MGNKHSLWAALCFIVFLLTACQSQLEVTISPTRLAGTQTPSVSSPTAVPTTTTRATVPPTLTPSIMSTSAPSPTLRPSNTPRPSATAVPTLATQLELPGWIDDPDTAVLMIRTQEMETAVSFINAHNGDRFDLKTPTHFPAIAWGKDAVGHYFEVIDDAFRDRVYVTTGAATRLSSELLVERTAVPTATSVANTPSHTVTILEDVVFLIDASTGNEIALEDPFDSRYTDKIVADWSANEAYLWVWRGHAADSENTDVGDIVIYDPDGNILSISEGTDIPVWTPAAGSQLLYTDIFNGRRLCINEIATGLVDCDLLSLWLEEHEVKLAQFMWSPDGRDIFFTFTRPANVMSQASVGFCTIDVATHDIHCPLAEKPNGWLISQIELSPTEELVAIYYRYVGESEQGIKEICFYNWRVDDVNCPVNETTLLNEDAGTWYDNFFIHMTSWSPDGRFLSLILHNGCPSCGDRTKAKLAIVDSEENRLTWQAGFIDYRKQSMRWRPLLQNGS